MIIILVILLFINFDIVSAYEKYNIGDKVNYKGVDYHVIKKSGANNSFVALLKDEPLTYDEVTDKYINDNMDDYLFLPFSSNNNYCVNRGNGSSCVSNYDDTNIKTYIESWANNKVGADNLVEVNGYKSRLLNSDDIEGLGFHARSSCSYRLSCAYSSAMVTENTQHNYDYYYDITAGGRTYRSCHSVDDVRDISTILEYYNCDIDLCDSQGRYVGNISDYSSVIKSRECNVYYHDSTDLVTDNEYDWLNYNNLSFWTMYDLDSFIFRYVASSNSFNSGQFGGDYEKYDNLVIRPVIDLKKSSLGSRTNYYIGEKITFKDEIYNVIANSDENSNYVIVLKYVPLTENQVGVKNGQEGFAKVSFYNSDNCNSKENSTGCTGNFEESNIKSILDEWINNNLNVNDLIAHDGYKYRLITLDELVDDLGYEYFTGSSINIKATENTPSWVYNSAIYYWIMPNKDESEMGTAGYGGYLVNRLTDFVLKSHVLDRGQIRPVIFLSKCALGDAHCELCPSGIAKYDEISTIKKYSVGDKVTYRNEEYYVIKDSDENNNVLTLLKANSLSVMQLNDYFDFDKFYYIDPTVDGIQFYSTFQCKDVDYVNHTFPSNCTSSFNYSLVKSIIDKWASKELNKKDLVEVDGYKVRLLTTDEVINVFKYELRSYFNGSIDTMDYLPTEDTYDWAYTEGERYWLMDGLDDRNETAYYVGDIMNYTHVYGRAKVRPVINIEKCSVDDACNVEMRLVACEEKPEKDEEVVTKPTIVEVVNTLSTTSKILLFVSFGLIVVGVSLLIYSLKKGSSKNS